MLEDFNNEETLETAKEVAIETAKLAAATTVAMAVTFIVIPTVRAKVAQKIQEYKIKKALKEAEEKK